MQFCWNYMELFIKKCGNGDFEMDAHAYYPKFYWFGSL